MTTVKWRHWYPDGCIMGDFDATEITHATSGAEAAEILIQEYVEENGVDGSSKFAVEISEPESFVGIYDVNVEWDPRTVATKREAVEA
jgi:hypothetical protein